MLVTQFCPILSDPMDYMACQASLSMGFSREEYWSGLPFFLPGKLPDPGNKPVSPVSLAAAVAAKSLQSCLTMQPHRWQPRRLPRPWDSPGKNTGVDCHNAFFHCNSFQYYFQPSATSPTPQNSWGIWCLPINNINLLWQIKYFQPGTEVVGGLKTLLVVIRWKSASIFCLSLMHRLQ